MPHGEIEELAMSKSTLESMTDQGVPNERWLHTNPNMFEIDCRFSTLGSNSKLPEFELPGGHMTSLACSNFLTVTKPFQMSQNLILHGGGKGFL